MPAKDLALSLVEKTGLPAFPVGANQDHATTRTDWLRELFDDHPRSSPALVTGNTFVVEVRSPNSSTLNLPGPTYTRTFGSALHYYYKTPLGYDAPATTSHPTCSAHLHAAGSTVVVRGSVISDEPVKVLTPGEYEDLLDEFSPTSALPEFTERWFARQLRPGLQDSLRYVGKEDQWYKWDGRRWAETTYHLADVDNAIEGLAHRMNARREVVGEAEAKSVVSGLKKAGTARLSDQVAKLLSRHPPIAMAPDQFDRRELELNTPAGVVSLETGTLQPPDRDAMHSKTTAVAPVAAIDAPLWSAFLTEIALGDKDLAAFLQRMAGYALSGKIDTHALFYLYGSGGNGKSVFVKTIQHILDDYSTTAPLTALVRTRREEHPTELAGLMGARLVTAPETKPDVAWDTQLIKALTSGDEISARFMRGDYFTFKPRFNIWVVGNTPPCFDVVDNAIRRRLHVIPFDFQPDEEDVELEEKLFAEAPAILRWAIDGFLQYRQIGLAPPDRVRRATKKALKNADPVQRFLEDSCEIGPHDTHRVAKEDLESAWKVWCAQNNETAWSIGTVKSRIEQAVDVVPKKVGQRRRRGYWGLRLRQQREDF